MKPKNYILRVYQKGRMVERYETSHKRSFLNQLRSLNFKELKKNKPYCIFLRVSYGQHEDVWGEKTTFFNDGRYLTKKDLWQAFNAFTEI